ncbi:MAG: 30S ribosome-binding factor RbfA [Pseudomonadales bacterium]|jgi:ribosome-binding factor A|nr:30S ribosome-binding factor RbfA [Pseudomonadales bacterium]
MQAQYKRTDRVAEQIQKILAVLIHKELKDPRLGMLTINEVRVTKDLAYADVFFSVFPDEHAEQTQLLLSNASSFLRKQLASELSTRITPKLRFRFDSSLVEGQKIDTALAGHRIAGDRQNDEPYGQE